MKNKSWTKGAIKRKEYLDKREELASDMEVLIEEITKLPPGQLKKILTDPVITILNKYGIVFD